MIYMSSNLIITCPVYGYTFRNENFQSKKKKILCPMCSYQFKDRDFPPARLDEFFF